ncbi:hypothetical protein AAGR22_10790 [Erwinia sp. HDF1-3R]|uniref:hypothetical protein n=1 Tax=Erwinia sp. HDF1-3R TaxID=3141543 RepID=UPI0031F58D24
MIYRFTLAAAVAAITLTGCAKNQAGGPPPDFFSGPSQIDVSHLTTKADDGSSVFVTIDGNEGGMLTRGESKALHIPDGKHKVGGYVRTLFGYGRVTIDPITVVSKKGEVRHVAYSVTRNKPSFTDRGETPLPPAPVKPAAPAVAQQTTTTTQPAVTAAQQTTTTAQPAATAAQQTTTAAQPAATAAQQTTATAQPAATATQQTTTTAQPAATAAQQTTATAQPAATAAQQTTAAAQQSSPSAAEKSTTSAAEAASTQQIIDAYGETSSQE